jgi:hypothetical protein
MEDAENDGRKTFQGEFDDAFGHADAGEFDAETDTEALSSVSGDEVEAAEFEAGQPFDAAVAQFIEEDPTNGVTAR